MSFIFAGPDENAADAGPAADEHGDVHATTAAATATTEDDVAAATAAKDDASAAATESDGHAAETPDVSGIAVHFTVLLSCSVNCVQYICYAYCVYT